ncbi:MAG: hypothetical protein C3F13_04765 [Anaerolineales bacterium]|nr:DUF1622 domain-containing protein [Anaerolineae bacterium]PWB55232.1 MAG: hypothetical protein C3F13_04765 [Anaerolineales bacterium]
MELIKVTSVVIEYLAVVIITSMVIYSTVRYLILLIGKRNPPDVNYREYKHSLGKGLLLGMEILVAADVIRTVALEPTFANLAALGLLVLVRTFLSWSLVVEMESRWPWQKKAVSVEEPRVS